MSGTIAEEILAQEESLTQAMRKLDIRAFDRIYADDAIVTGVTGEVTGKMGILTEVERARGERDTAAAQGKKLVVSLDKEDIKVVTHGNTAVASYRLTVRMETEEGDIHHRCRTTNVWLKGTSQWRIIAGHNASLDPQERKVQIHNGQITLSGTLTLPATDAPHPCIVLQLAASQARMLGAQSAFGSRYLNQLANDLAHGGIASLWYEMRGADLSDKDYLEFTLSDFANDALAAVRFLEQRPEIDSNRIGLCGLSEGGWTVALAASRSKRVDFLVLLESPSLTVQEADRLQKEAMARARGATEAEIREIHLGLKRIYQASRSGKVDEALEADLRKHATKALESLPRKQRPSVDSFVQSEINRFLSPNYRYLLDFEPAKVFRKIQCPILALFGEMSLVVPVEKHLAAMKADFQAGGNTAFAMRTIPRANHTFMDAGNGPQELMPSKIVFAPGFPDVIADWILQLK